MAWRGAADVGRLALFALLALAAISGTSNAQAVAADSATAAAEEFYGRRLRRDWAGAAALLEQRAIRALLDQTIASRAFREAYPPALPSVETLLESDPAMTRERAASRVAEVQAQSWRAYVHAAPFLASMELRELRAVPLQAAAVALVRGMDPRENYLAFNAVGACPAGQWIAPGSWTPPRVLGAVALDDSTFWVAVLDEPRAGRPIPRVMGVEMAPAERIPVEWLVAMRTAEGWRLRLPIMRMAATQVGDCVTAPR